MEFILTIALLIGSARMEAKAPPLVYEADLGVRATHRAERLCGLPLSHQGWQESFRGSKWPWVGENLVSGYATGQEAHRALMESPTHKANILSKRFKAVGIGQAPCGVAVEFFGGY